MKLHGTEQPSAIHQTGHFEAKNQEIVWRAADFVGVQKGQQPGRRREGNQLLANGDRAQPSWQAQGGNDQPGATHSCGRQDARRSPPKPASPGGAHPAPTGGATTIRPDATHPPAICQNLRGGGGGGNWGGGGGGIGSSAGGRGCARPTTTTCIPATQKFLAKAKKNHSQRSGIVED